jgi:nicotinamidase/pyrazinamidase
MSSSSHPTKVTLLLVDVQKDFHPGGSLAIPTADADAERIAAFIRKHGTTSIDRIVATMDSHYKLHIAHPGFWVHGSTGRNPDPFTIITSNDVRNGTWRPRDDLDVPVTHWPDPTVFAAYANVLTTTTTDGLSSSSSKFDWTKYCIEYTSQLEAKGRFQLCIWPEHCLIGSVGHGMVDVVMQAALDWSHTTGHSIEWVMKGQNILTEMYSAMAAEVPITTSTAFCADLQADLVGSVASSSSDDTRRDRRRRLLVCGQASSHCVNHTVRDIVAHWPVDRRSNEIVVLSDCTSAVPGFEAAAELFRTDMTAAGVQFLTSTDPNVFSS